MAFLATQSLSCDGLQALYQAATSQLPVVAWSARH